MKLLIAKQKILYAVWKQFFCSLFEQLKFPYRMLFNWFMETLTKNAKSNILRQKSLWYILKVVAVWPANSKN